MLFAFAVTSSIFNILLGFSFNVRSGIRQVFIVIDFCINLWCLVLQFKFAEGQYKRWCFRCDAQCRNCMSRRTRNLVHKKTNESAREYANVQVEESMSRSSTFDAGDNEQHEKSEADDSL